MKIWSVSRLWATNIEDIVNELEKELNALEKKGWDVEAVEFWDKNNTIVVASRVNPDTKKEWKVREH